MSNDGSRRRLIDTRDFIQAIQQFLVRRGEPCQPLIEQLNGMFERDWAGRGTRAKPLNVKERITAGFVAYMEMKRIGWW